jgi:predicted dehydrogenase
MYRFHPFIQQALEMVKEGKLGDIYAVEAHMSRDDKMEKRQWLGQFKGGMTFYLGCHLIDLIHTFLGVPEEVIPMNTCATKEVGTEDLGMVLFRYPGGLSFCKACGAEPGGFMRRQLVICGTLGSLEIRPLEQYTCGIPYYCDSVLYTSLRKEPDKPLAWVKPAEVTPCEPYHRYRGVFEDFAQKIRSGKPTSEEELLREARVHRILLASCGIDCDYKGEITL